MVLMGYKFLYMKIITSIVSAIVFSLAGALKGYTPISERVSDSVYYSFSGLFAFNFVPSFFTFFILGACFSPIVDGIVMKRFELKGVKGIFIVLGAYVLLGVISGVLLSMFFLEMDIVRNFIFLAAISDTVV